MFARLFEVELSMVDMGHVKPIIKCVTAVCQPLELKINRYSIANDCRSRRTELSNFLVEIFKSIYLMRKEN